MKKVMAIVLASVLLFVFASGCAKRSPLAPEAPQKFSAQAVDTMLDNAEDANVSYNQLGGAWTTSVWTDGYGAVTLTAGGANGTSYALRLMGSVSGDPWSFTAFSSALNSAGTASGLSGYSGLEFYHKGTACTGTQVSYMVALETDNITDASYWYYIVTVPATWEKVSVQWTALTNPGWGQGAELSLSEVLAHAKAIRWSVLDISGGPASCSGFAWVIDEIKLIAAVPATATPVRTPVTGNTIDTGEDNNISTNDLGGPWYSWASEGSVATLASVPGGANSTSYAIHFSGNIAGQSWGSSAVYTYLKPEMSKTDLRAKGGLEFYHKGNACSGTSVVYMVQIMSENITDASYWHAFVTIPAGWTKAQLQWSVFEAPAWGMGAAMTREQVLQNATGFMWAVADVTGGVASCTGFNWYVDEIKLLDGAPPTPTFTSTPTMQPTTTDTMAIDNNEDNSVTYNQRGGTWGEWASVESSANLSSLAGGANGTSYAMLFSGNITGHGWPASVVSTFLRADSSTVDLRSMTGLEFYQKGNGCSGTSVVYLVQLMTDNITDASYWRAFVTIPAGWTKVQLPWAAFEAAPWGMGASMTRDEVLQHVTGVVWAVGDNTGAAASCTGFNWYLDEIQLYSGIPPTATFTPTATATNTFTRTPTASATVVIPATIDNFEDSNLVNLLGGTWDKWAVGTSTLKILNAGAVRTTRSVRFTASLEGGPWTGGGVFTNMNSSGTAVDISSKKGINFYHRGSACSGTQVSYNVVLVSDNITDYSYWQATVTIPAKWTKVGLPWSSFVKPAWGQGSTLTRAQVLKRVTSIHWQASDSTGQAAQCNGLVWDIDEVTFR